MKLRAALFGVVLLAATAGVKVPGVSGQGLDAIILQCGTLSSTSASDRCVESGVGAQAILAQTGLAFSLGSEVAGSASTLGRRLGTSPRIAFSVRAGAVQGRIPDIVTRGTNTAAAPELGFLLPTVHTSVTVGLFDGFKLAPTAGGFLSVDVTAGAALAFLPASQGFAGTVTALSGAARIGLLRETFTLPGITLSAAHRRGQEVRFGDVEAGGPSIAVDPSVTSLRLTIGKDLVSVGILGGLGWDDYSGSARLGLIDGTGLPAGAVEQSINAGRMLVFGGTSLTFLVLQLSIEAGWAEGLSTTPSYQSAPFDPSGGSVFASLSARLTL